MRDFVGDEIAAEHVNLVVALRRPAGRDDPAGTRHEPAVRGCPADAGYPHTLGILPPHHGERLGECVVAWVEASLRERGLRGVRRNCVASNEVLRRYYEGMGYGGRGVGTVDGYRLRRFEKNLE